MEQINYYMEIKNKMAGKGDYNTHINLRNLAKYTLLVSTGFGLTYFGQKGINMVRDNVPHKVTSLICSTDLDNQNGNDYIFGFKDQEVKSEHIYLNDRGNFKDLIDKEISTANSMTKNSLEDLSKEEKELKEKLFE